MTQAETYRNESPEFQDLVAHLPELSAASQSESRADRIFADGSALTMTSRNGEPVKLELREATELELHALAAEEQA